MPILNDLKFSAEDFIDWCVVALDNGKEYYFPKKDLAMRQKQLNDPSLEFIEFDNLMGASRIDQKTRRILEWASETPKTLNKQHIMMVEDMHYSHSVMLNVPTGLQVLLQIRVQEFFGKINKPPTKDELVGMAVAMMTEVKESADKADQENEEQSSLEEKIEEAENKEAPNQLQDENSNLENESNKSEESKA